MELKPYLLKLKAIKVEGVANPPCGVETTMAWISVSSRPLRVANPPCGVETREAHLSHQEGGYRC